MTDHASTPAPSVFDWLISRLPFALGPPTSVGMVMTTRRPGFF